MEVAPSIQEISGHTASLLTCLNIQRQQALFCDCVVRQRQSPAQLYPAHRCVLAASSPVLASILSSTGALVELHASCLSDHVLPLLLDFIYTGALPGTHSQQQYCSLLSAAGYLQMDKLQVALCAWNQTEVDMADKTNASTETENHSLSQEHSGSKEPRIKEAEADICGAINITGANCTLGNVHSCTSESSVNRGNYRQVTDLTPQNLIQNTPSTTEGHSVSRVDRDIQKDQFHLAGTVKPMTWQKNTEAELVRTAEGKRSSSSSSSLLPSMCSGAVPVICHSSTAVSSMPSYHPVCQASVNFNRPPPSRSERTEIECCVETITAENHHKLENLDYRNNKDDIGAVGWDFNDRSDQCTTQDETDMPKQDYTCSGTNCFKKLNDEHVKSVLSPITDHNNHYAHYVAFQSKNHKNHVRHDSVSQHKVYSSFIRGLKYNPDLSFDDLHSKHQRFDSSDSHGLSTFAATEEHSEGLRAGVPHSEEDSDTGNDSYSKDFIPREDRHGHCSLYGPKADWYSRLHRADTSANDGASSQHEHDLDNADSDEVCLPVSSTQESSLGMVPCGHSAFERSTSLDLEAISDPETLEPPFPVTVPVDINMSVDSNMSDSMYSAVGQSYHGYVRYHCLPQEDMHLSHGETDHKHSYPTYLHHLDQSSDEEGGTFNNLSREHLATGTTEQVLLLDISTKHSELLVSYKHREDQDKKAVGTEIRKDNRNEATSVAGVNSRTIRSRKMFGAEHGDESGTKSELRKSVSREHSRSGPEVKNNVGVMEELSKHEEGENQTSTLTVCSAPRVSDSVQASVSSTLSVCIPSVLPASVSTNISAHLSTPVHHAFQCTLCDRSFSQRGSLNRHVRSHLGVRPFPCPRCPMTFSRQYRVTEHMRVHQRCILENDFPKPPAPSI